MSLSHFLLISVCLKWLSTFVRVPIGLSNREIPFLLHFYTTLQGSLRSSTHRLPSNTGFDHLDICLMVQRSCIRIGCSLSPWNLEKEETFRVKIFKLIYRGLFMKIFHFLVLWNFFIIIFLFWSKPLKNKVFKATAPRRFSLIFSLLPGIAFNYYKLNHRAVWKMTGLINILTLFQIAFSFQCTKWAEKGWVMKNNLMVIPLQMDGFKFALKLYRVPCAPQKVIGMCDDTDDWAVWSLIRNFRITFFILQALEN